MKIIQKLADMIEEELHDAYKYAECAILHEDDPERAKTFRTLASEELGHVNRLHEQVVRLIKKYRDEHGNPPPEMQARYDYLHERHISKAAEVRMLLV